MKRRDFFKLIGLSSIITIVPYISYAAGSLGSIVALIKDDLYYLDLDEKGLMQFAHDYGKKCSKLETLKIQILYMFGFTSKNSQNVKLMSYNYLMSTDFFRNKMDENKTLHYLGLYDPYKMSCSHPFNHVFYSK